jgi:predicted branched-subunit amino acid permease
VRPRLKGGGKSTSHIQRGPNRHEPVQPRTVDRQIAVAALTLGGAVGVFAIAFGVGAVAAGASVAQTCAMSLLVFTGASQFSAVSVVAEGGSTGAASLCPASSEAG